MISENFSCFDPRHQFLDPQIIGTNVIEGRDSSA